jgi:hypothetical protein
MKRLFHENRSARFGKEESECVYPYRYGDEMALVAGAARVLISCADEFLEG